jgi:ferredoxin-fold anticodon binding domain-containing protein
MSEAELRKFSVEKLRDLKKIISGIIKEKIDEEKEAKEKAKEQRATEAKESLVEGNVILFLYKGEECEGEVKEVREKTFSVAFTYGGEDKVLARAYHLFISHVDID